MSKLEEVAKLYNRYPYPPVGVLAPLFTRLKRDDLVLLNYEAGFATCYGKQPSKAAPRILIMGCGTMEAVAVAAANPSAEIVAVDISAKSLRKLRWMCLVKGISQQIRLVHSSLEDFQERGFDYLIATGVLHHLENPEAGLAKLKTLGTETALFRFMIYSKWGRDLLYGAKEMAKILSVASASEFRGMIEALPANHPYRIYFHLYSDVETDAGLMDGYLHPCDNPFTAKDLASALERNGLAVGKFLHRPSGQPSEFSSKGSDWEKLAQMELLGIFEENFCFFAGRAEKMRVATGPWIWNPILPEKGILQSRLLGQKVYFDRTLPPQEKHIEKFKESLLLLPEEKL